MIMLNFDQEYELKTEKTEDWMISDVINDIKSTIIIGNDNQDFSKRKRMPQEIIRGVFVSYGDAGLTVQTDSKQFWTVTGTHEQWNSVYPDAFFQNITENGVDYVIQAQDITLKYILKSRNLLYSWKIKY